MDLTNVQPILIAKETVLAIKMAFAKDKADVHLKNSVVLRKPRTCWAKSKSALLILIVMALEHATEMKMGKNNVKVKVVAIQFNSARLMKAKML